MRWLDTNPACAWTAIAFATSLAAPACGGDDAPDPGPSDAGAQTADAGNDAAARDAAADGGPNCNDSVPCPAAQRCDRGPGVCGGPGFCVARPAAPGAACPSSFCGCDGKTYCSDDAAHAIGVEIAVKGTCTFACGSATCDALTQYCETATGGAQLPDGGANVTSTCKALPDTCKAGPRACNCLTPPDGASSCSDVDGHIVLQLFLP